MPKTVKTCVEKMVALFEKECKKAKKDENYKLDEGAIEKVILSTAPLKRGAKPDDGKPKVKRPPSAYMNFANANREKVKKDHPKFSVTEIMKEIGARWQKLSDTEKESYKK